jgi:hypothetical protein
MQVVQTPLSLAHDRRKRSPTQDRWSYDAQIDRWINEGGALNRRESELPYSESVTVFSARQPRGKI